MSAAITPEATTPAAQPTRSLLRRVAVAVWHVVTSLPVALGTGIAAGMAIHAGLLHFGWAHAGATTQISPMGTHHFYPLADFPAFVGGLGTAALIYGVGHPDSATTSASAPGKVEPLERKQLHSSVE